MEMNELMEIGTTFMQWGAMFVIFGLVTIVIGAAIFIIGKVFFKEQTNLAMSFLTYYLSNKR